MVEHQSYVLKWNNFNKVLNYKFYEYFEQQKYCDVTLSAEGEFVKAHKMMLAACSPYFEKVFDSSNEHQMTIMMASEISLEDLMNVLDFAYKGEVTVNSKDFDRFIKISKLLQLKGIIQNGDLVDKIQSPQQKQQLPPTPPNEEGKPKQSRPDPLHFVEIAVDSSITTNPFDIKPEPVTPVIGVIKRRGRNKRKLQEIGEFLPVLLFYLD